MVFVLVITKIVFFVLIYRAINLTEYININCKATSKVFDVCSPSYTLILINLLLSNGRHLNDISTRILTVIVDTFIAVLIY